MSSAVTAAATIASRAGRLRRLRSTHASASSSSDDVRVSRRGIALGCPLAVLAGVGTNEARAVDYFTTPPNTLEFENVAFPRYPGFVTLPSGVQVRDLCVGSGPAAATTRSLDVIVKMWTVHQGRYAGEARVAFVPGDETVIRGLEQAVLAGGNMRVGGTRRALIPPKASVSWPYVQSGETDADEDATGARTRFGMAPAYDPALGVQKPLTSGVGPVPKREGGPRAADGDGDEKSAPADGDGDGNGAWLDYVLRRNAFTIKPSDRSVLVDVTLVAVGGESGGRGVVRRVPTREDHAALGEANDRSGDGGASWWTAALPGASEYCPG